MNDAVLMSVFKTFRGLKDAVQCLFKWHWSVILDVMCKIGSFDIFHRQKWYSVDLIGIVGGDDIWMSQQLGGGFGFAKKSFDLTTLGE